MANKLLKPEEMAQELMTTVRKMPKPVQKAFLEWLSCTLGGFPPSGNKAPVGAKK